MNRELNSEYWDERYLNDSFAWDLGAISPPLKTYFDQIEDKEMKILIPGAGNSYEAEYLFNAGFKNVFICEISSVAISNFKLRCPLFDKTHILKINFFDLQDLHFDLVVEQTFFCALDPDLRQRYFNKIIQVLKPGGKLMGLLFDVALNKDKPPFGGTKEEYLSYIKPPLKIKTFEAAYNSIKPRAGTELFVIVERA